MSGPATQFWRWLRPVLPPGWILLITAVPLIGARLYIEYEWRKFRVVQDDENVFAHIWGDGLRSMLYFWSALCFGLGVFRALKNHPAFDGAYFAWLRNSPWKWPSPLPRGPVFPTWKDLITLFALAGMSWGVPTFSAGLSILCAVAGYSAALVFLLGPDFRHGYYGVAFTWLAAIHFRDSAVLQFLFILCGLGIACFFTAKGFQDFHEWGMVRYSGLGRMLGWPYRQLSPQPRPNYFSVLDGIMIGCLMTGLVWLIAPPGMINTETSLDRSIDRDFRWIVFPWMLTACGPIAAGLAISRIALYHFEGIRPPLSFLGRWRTKRWILPRYDGLWLLLLILPVAAFVMLMGMFLFPFSPPTFLGPTIGVCFALVISLPPSLEKWRLTGEVRFVRVHPSTPSRSGRSIRAENRS